MPTNVETQVYLLETVELEFAPLPTAIVQVYLLNDAELEIMLS